MNRLHATCSRDPSVFQFREHVRTYMHTYIHTYIYTRACKVFSLQLHEARKCSGAAVIRKSRVKESKTRRPVEWYRRFFFVFLLSREGTILFSAVSSLSSTSSRSRLRSTTARASERVLRFKNRRGHADTSFHDRMGTRFILPFPLFGFHSIRQALAKIAAVIPPLLELPSRRRYSRKMDFSPVAFIPSYVRTCTFVPSRDTTRLELANCERNNRFQLADI